MKAVVCPTYGSPEVLQVASISRPTPKDDEVLIKNYAASITRADTFLRSGTPRVARLFLGWSKPKKSIIGTGYSGEIIQKGKNVKDYNIGDMIFGETTFNFSTNAEFVCVNTAKDVIHLVPESLEPKEATTLCDGYLTSYNFLVKIGKLTKDQHVLINGASGSLGIAAIQIAKYIGAEVTAVCSTRNIQLVKEMGADHIIDYTKEDFTQHRNRYDIIFDTVDTSTYGASKKALTANGQFLSPAIGGSILMASITTSLFGKKKAKFAATGMRKTEELNQFIREFITWFNDGSLNVFIEKTYLISEIREAHAFMETGRKRGNIVLTFEH